jgi:hypothetical protein
MTLPGPTTTRPAMATSVPAWTSRSRRPGSSAQPLRPHPRGSQAGATPVSRWRSPAGATALAKRSTGIDPPMSFRRGAIVSMKAGRLHLVHTANGRAIAGRVEIPDTATRTTNVTVHVGDGATRAAACPTPRVKGTKSSRLGVRRVRLSRLSAPRRRS